MIMLTAFLITDHGKPSVGMSAVAPFLLCICNQRQKGIVPDSLNREDKISGT